MSKTNISSPKKSPTQPKLKTEYLLEIINDKNCNRYDFLQAANILLLRIPEKDVRDKIMEKENGGSYPLPSEIRNITLDFYEKDLELLMPVENRLQMIKTKTPDSREKVEITEEVYKITTRLKDAQNTIINDLKDLKPFIDEIITSEKMSEINLNSPNSRMATDQKTPLNQSLPYQNQWALEQRKSNANSGNGEVKHDPASPRSDEDKLRSPSSTTQPTIFSRVLANGMSSFLLP